MTAPSRVRSRRRTRLAQTAGIAVLGIVTAGIWVASKIAPDADYVPGESIEGLTAELVRDLPADRPQLTFTDVTAEAGIDFVHFGGRRTSEIVEDMGSGVAWGDFDADGWPDLFVVNANSISTPDTVGPRARAHLYRNQGDGSFREMAAEAGVIVDGIGMGAAWADFDNDGHLDLAVSGYPRLYLFHNRGDGRFVDVSEPSGLAAPRGFWAGVSWGDYDRDGRLDLYVTGYVRYEPNVGGGPSSQYAEEGPASLNPSSFDPERNLLFHNEGGGRFTDRAAEAGVTDGAGRGLSASWIDLNADGWPDLYVANDVSDNALFLNRGDGTFENRSHRALVADYRGSMGIAAGDWDGDLDLDLFLTHWIAQENALYSNLLSQLSAPEDDQRRLQFRDEAERFGLGQIALDYVGWATSFVDVDNDGRLDLFVVNGSTFQQDDHPALLVGMRDQLFWNGGPERGFFDIGPAVGSYFTETRVGRGGATADYDRDGDLDLFVVNHSERAVLLRNDGPGGNWIQMELEGTESNRDGFGAVMTLFSRDSVVGFRQHGSQSSYLSQNDAVLHFGLGALRTVDSAVVEWPAGFRQNTGAADGGGRLRVRERGDAVWTVSTPAMSERDRVTTFWTVFRAAGRARIAGDHGEALAAYRRAHALDPTHEDVLYYRGHMARDLGQLEEAAEAWRRLVELNPLSARGFTELGWLQLCGEPGLAMDPTAARDAFRAAMAINPEHTRGWIDASIAALAAGDMEDAEDLISRIRRTDPEGPGGRFLAAFLSWRSGDIVRALELVNRRGTTEAEGPGTSEGDTKEGGALVAVQSRCHAIRRFTNGVPPQDNPAVFVTFDSLLVTARTER